jgi:bifunctional DNA-binding transcriptional regulator/antitoxin component of YhaV-PrlF toxin-antitoxin module
MLSNIMIMKRKLIKVGDDVGIILPKKLLAYLKAGVGDTLSATVTADGVELVLSDAKPSAAVLYLSREGKGAPIASDQR